MGRRVAFDVRNRGNVVTVRAGSKSRLTAAFVSTPLHLWLAVLVVLALGTSGTVYARFRRRRRSPVPVRAANAVGDSACLSCHTAKSTFEQTAHRRTMSRPSRESIEGSFRPGDNILRAEHSDVHFRMDTDSAGFYESLVSNGDTTLRRERIAIVGGSGRKGQSFLYWSGDRLFQLPVSYYTELHRWIGSPGRAGIDPRTSFNRAVAPRCFECHATWIESVPDLTTNNRYVDTGTILGITCERCHASGAEHVARERSVLRKWRDPMIVNPARMTRERQMDMCAQCHAGPGDPEAPPFTYVGGRPLERYLHIIPRAPDDVVDVHANQVALLERSRCYASSQMTCLTCHDVHRPQRDVTELSGRCLTCHREQSCPLFATRGHAIAGRCVDCHMPLRTSKLVVSDLEGEMERIQGRSHWIRVYPETANR